MNLHPIEAAVAAFASRPNTIPRGQTIIVGVSGGPDSVALLLALLAANQALAAQWSLQVAHLDHQLRGPESAEDAEFVTRLCAARAIPCHATKQDVAQQARQAHVGIEEAARRARYEFFRTLAKQTGAAAVALGHNRDDQVETVLHRLLRGTGLRGLAGMKAVRPLAPDGHALLVRPLLQVPRRDVLDYLQAKGQAYRVDATNQDASYRRNWLRHQLLPLLAVQYGPRVDAAVARLSQLAEEVTDYVEAQALQAYGQVRVAGDGERVELDCARLADLPPALQEPVLLRAWRELGLGEKSLDFAARRRLVELASGADASGGLSLPGAEARRTRDRLVVQPRAADRRVEGEHALALPGRVRLEGVGVEIVAEPEAGDSPWSFAATPDEEVVDADRLVRPLVVRGRRPGDVFHPLGAPGRRKLKRFFIDAKVGRALRDATPLVADRDGIVWVVGQRIDDRVKITPQTRSAVRLSVAPLA